MGDSYDDWLERVEAVSPEPPEATRNEPAASEAARNEQAASEAAQHGPDGPGGPNDVEADNAAEQETVEAVDPANAPD